MADKKDLAITIGAITIKEIEYIELTQLEINHTANEHAQARLTVMMEEKKAQKLISQADMDKIKITAKVNKKDVVLFQGYITNLKLQPTLDYNMMTIELMDASILLDLKRESCSFQKLDAKYEDVLKPAYKDSGGKVQFKATDKAIEKMILRLNETAWEFTKRMASQFNAMVFTDITAEKPLINIGLPEPKKTVELEPAQIKYNFMDRKYQEINSNADYLAKGSKVIKEDFSSVQVRSYEYLYVADVVKLDKKSYCIKSVNAKFEEDVLTMEYELVGKTAFVVPVIKHWAASGRIFRAQVKKVEKDKVQVHLFDIDEKYDNSSTTWFPFATVYSSGDGSGWYVMPEVDDYIRILIPSEDVGEAFAMSSINTAPLKEPKNKSLKAPGGREILLTDKGVEIIAEHQKTFIMLDKSGGINIVSSKDIQVHADGNISFEAKGKIQLVAQKEIDIQSGQSHVKVLNNQIDMGGSNIIVGE